MKYKKCHIVKLTNSHKYTFTFLGDAYTEPDWYFDSIKEVKKAIDVCVKTKRYPMESK
jgi:hypothetical protein